MMSYFFLIKKYSEDLQGCRHNTAFTKNLAESVELTEVAVKRVREWYL